MKHVNFIIAFENGEVSQKRLIDGFAAMIADGTVWHLQGGYGRTAHALIERGYISAEGNVLDYHAEEE